MDCGSAREAISAVLDGELATAETRLLDRHLERCPACRAWREDAYELTRRMRLSVVTAAPAPDAGLVAAVTATGYGRGTPRASWPARVSLVLLALGQVAIAIPVFVLGTDRHAPMHVAHEMGSFDLAIAAGFLAAACRPRLARGMRALVGVAAVLLLVTAVIDLAAGRTTLLDEAPHLLTIAGWVLLEVLARQAPDDRERPDLAVSGGPTRAASVHGAGSDSERGYGTDTVGPPGPIARRAVRG